MAEYEDIDERIAQLQIQVSLLRTIILQTADALHKVAKALEDVK